MGLNEYLQFLEQEAVWQKGHAVFGYDPAKWRKDDFGAWIQRSAYGTTQDFGWEIDHVVPTALGGLDDLDNKRPLHWSNNRSKGARVPWTFYAGPR